MAVEDGQDPEHERPEELKRQPQFPPSPQRRSGPQSSERTGSAPREGAQRHEPERDDALRASEGRFRQLVEGVLDYAIFVLDAQGRVETWNAGAERIKGYTAEEIIGRPYETFFTTEDVGAGRPAALLAEATRAGRVADEGWRVRKDGTRFWASAVLTAIRDEDGELTGFSKVTRDLTERREAAEQNAYLRRLLERIADSVVTLEGPELWVTYMNAAAERTLCRTQGECVGRPLAEVFPDMALPEFHDELRRVTTEQRPTRFEAFFPPLERWLEVRAYPVDAVVLALFEDVTARREAAARAEEARVLAEAASRAKSDFLAAMSHELRTPLNAISGYVDLLQMELAGPLTAQQRAYLERTRSASEALLTIVNSVLDLARLASGRAAVPRVVARIATASDAAVALLMPQALEKGVTLVNACGEGAAYCGEESRVQQVLTNLVANAVKFTPSGGYVSVTCGASDEGPGGTQDGVRVAADGPPGPERGWVVIRVQDTGVGIPPEALERIFEPFEQVEAGLTRAHGGTGLGLTISRHLARLMGGDITVESAFGEGSNFLLYLPAATPEEVAAMAPAEGERRTRSRYARGLGLVSDVVLGEVERILQAYARRLRADPATPSAHRMPQAQLDDHTASFLADIAQTLALIEAAHGGPSESIRDGTAIQRVVAERHGRQRARLGWTEAEMRREFQILREEVTAAVHRRVVEIAATGASSAAGPAEQAAPVDEALALLARFADHAERAGLEAFRKAAGTQAERD